MEPPPGANGSFFAGSSKTRLLEADRGNSLTAKVTVIIAKTTNFRLRSAWRSKKAVNVKRHTA